MMFRYFASGDFFLLVHGTASPDDATWDRYLDALRRLERPARSARILALTEGGGPNGPQRARMQEVTTQDDRTAVVSSAAVPRFTVSIIALMHRNIRSFSPSDFEEAAQYVHVTRDERRAAVEYLEKLRREGTMGTLRVVEEALQSARG